MLANKVLHGFLTAFAWLVLPVQAVTTFVLGLLVSVTFGLILLPLSAVWVVMLAPMLAISWLCSRFRVLRNPLGFLGIPWAVLAHTFACMVPSMGEFESRAAKLMIAESWPYSWEFWQFQSGKIPFALIEGSEVENVFLRIARDDSIKQRTLQRIAQREPLDPHV